MDPKFNKTGHYMSVILYIFAHYFIISSCFMFDQEYFGVVLETNVHLIEGSSTEPPPGMYTFETVKTMLTVIAEKFSNVIVSDSIAVEDQYVYNHTYWNGSRVAVFAGEAAAMINREGGRKRLSVLYYVNEIKCDKMWEAAMSLVFEAAERANYIYPDTVQGLYIGSESRNASVTEATLKTLQLYKGNSSRLGLNMGARLNYLDLRPPNAITGSVRTIVEQSDFLTFSIVPTDEIKAQGALTSFLALAEDFVSIKDALLDVNPALKVMAKTEWFSSERAEWATVENLRIYWETTSKWAAQKCYYMYHWEAFNNPFWTAQSQPDAAHRGWWKLTDNSKINSVEGYKEKVSESDNGSSSTTETDIEEPSTTETDIGEPSTTETDIGEPSTTTETDIEEPSTTENDIGEASATEIGIGKPPTVRHRLIIVMATAGVIFGVLALLSFIHFCRRTNKHATQLLFREIQEFMYGNPDESTIPEENYAMPPMVVNAPYDSSLEIPKEKLKIDKQQILGKGQFGCVFKAVLVVDDDGENITVAVKTARHVRDPGDLRGILYEIKVLSYLGSHANIVELKGAYTAELTGGLIYVVLEICTLGSLKKYLVQGKAMKMNTIISTCKKTDEAGEQSKYIIEVSSSMVHITIQDLVRWANEIASGMEYLERKHIVHADLATRNVLLNSNKTAKISDFGLSRRMYNYTNYVKKHETPLPWRWMAIESLRRLEFSSKSDVWSYGVTLWELFSMGDVPYSDLSWSRNFINRLANGLQPECPLHASSGIYSVMRDCWKLEPKERPTFTQLLVFTKEWLQQCSDPDTGADSGSNSGHILYQNANSKV